MDFQEIIFANDQFIAVHKDAGIPCQSKSPVPTPLDQSVPRLLGESVTLLHRIDQPVSGLVLFERPLHHHTPIALMESIHSKEYIAIVEGKVESPNGQLQNYLFRDGRKNKSLANLKKGKKAILTFDVLIRLERYTVLSIHLDTGRFHQIRAQMSLYGHPIKGDVKYGARRKNKHRGIDLHSYQYKLSHKGEITTITDHRFPNDGLWAIVANHLNQTQHNGKK